MLSSLSESGPQLATLWEAYELEAKGSLESTESVYAAFLDECSRHRLSCPIVLIHFLGFVRRTHGLAAAHEVFTDLLDAESDHITPEVQAFVRICLGWVYASDDDAANHVETTLKPTLAPRTAVDITVSDADFIAFSSANFRHGIKHLSRAMYQRPKICRFSCFWESWETLLQESGCDIVSAVYSNRMTLKLSQKSTAQPLSAPSDFIAAVQVDPELTDVDLSWFSALTTASKASARFKVGSIRPQSSLLDNYIDPNISLIDDQDGGDGPLNHILRPDVTKMIRFIPSEDVQRRVEVPKVIRSFMTYLPTRGPKSLNPTTLAEGSLRLLVSVGLPRSMTEEMLANVDRRSRMAIDQSRRKAAESKFTAGSYLDQGGTMQPAKVPIATTKEELSDDRGREIKGEITESASYRRPK